MKAEEDAKIEFLKAFNKVQGMIEPAVKDSLNPHFKSTYASLASVNQAVMGPLNEAGFVLISGGSDINGKPHLKTTLYHIAGHSESFFYPLTISENPQHVASSVSYARRYSICALLNLSVEDDDAEIATRNIRSAQPSEVARKVFAPRLSESVPSVSGDVISEQQAKRFYAIAKGAGKEDSEIKGYVVSELKVKRTNQIKKDDYNKACTWAAEKSEQFVEADAEFK